MRSEGQEQYRDALALTGAESFGYGKAGQCVPPQWLSTAMIRAAKERSG